MLPRSLTARLMLAAMVGMLTATVAGIAVMSALLWPGSPTAMLRAELAEEVERVETGLKVDAAGKVSVVFKAESANLYDAMPKDAAYVVLDDQGNVVAKSTDGPAVRVLLSEQSQSMRAGTSPVVVRSGDIDIRLRVAEQQIMHEGRRYTIRAARSDRLTTTLNDHAGELYFSAASVTILLALGIFMLVVYLTVSRMVRPLRTASQIAASIGPHNLITRLRADGLPTELVPLIEAFNTALTRLETGFRVQQEFLASAAHELKTPLALLQAEIELGGAANTAYLLRDTAPWPALFTSYCTSRRSAKDTTTRSCLSGCKRKSRKRSSISNALPIDIRCTWNCRQMLAIALPERTVARCSCWLKTCWKMLFTTHRPAPWCRFVSVHEDSVFRIKARVWRRAMSSSCSSASGERTRERVTVLGWD